MSANMNAVDWIYWVVLFGITIFIAALILVLDTFVLPRFRWYCQLRTWTFQLHPYVGALVGYPIGDGQYKVGRVEQVDVQHNAVLILFLYSSEGEAIVEQKWMDTVALRWFPWWCDFDGVALEDQ